MLINTHRPNLKQTILFTPVSIIFIYYDFTQLFTLIDFFNYSEFGIEGTRIYQNRTCLFTYNSDSIKYGKINSPRYPNNYPLNLKCTYLFNIANRYERILFTFKEFRLPNHPDRKE